MAAMGERVVEGGSGVGWKGFEWRMYREARRAERERRVRQWVEVEGVKEGRIVLKGGLGWRLGGKRRTNEGGQRTSEPNIFLRRSRENTVMKSRSQQFNRRSTFATSSPSSTRKKYLPAARFSGSGFTRRPKSPPPRVFGFPLL